MLFWGLGNTCNCTDTFTVSSTAVRHQGHLYWSLAAVTGGVEVAVSVICVWQGRDE